MPKDLSQLSTAELMEIAKNPVKEDEFKDLPPVRRFIISDGVQSGTEKIPAILIFDRYLKWTKVYHVAPLSNVHFFKELKLYFEKIKLANGFAYVMGSSGFDLSPHKLISVNSARKRISNGKNKIKKEHSS